MAPQACGTRYVPHGGYALEGILASSQIFWSEGRGARPCLHLTDTRYFQASGGHREVSS